MKPVTAAVPAGSEILRHLPGAHFHDCHAVAIAAPAPCALALHLAAMSATPSWVQGLMAARNGLVARLGLKDLGPLEAVDPAKPLDAYRVGDRVGIFLLQHLTDGEIILGQTDKHLDVKVSVHQRAVGPGAVVAVTTVVHIHNGLGRLYMTLVTPFHRRIVPALLQRMRLPPPGT